MKKKDVVELADMWITIVRAKSENYFEKSMKKVPLETVFAMVKTTEFINLCKTSPKDALSVIRIIVKDKEKNDAVLILNLTGFHAGIFLHMSSLSNSAMTWSPV